MQAEAEAEADTGAGVGVGASGWPAGASRSVSMSAAGEFPGRAGGECVSGCKRASWSGSRSQGDC